jgi:hypothetical protein
MNRKKRIPVATLLGVLVIAALLTGVAYFAWQRSRPPGPPASLSAEAARQLIHTKNVGLGLLENQRLEEGRESFESIAGQAPDDPLAARNIAVARVLALGVEFEEAPQETIAAAKVALGDVQRIEGESTAFHWLALRVAAAERDFDATEAHLQAIIDQQPEDAGAWYARYRIRRLADAAEPDVGH